MEQRRRPRSMLTDSERLAILESLKTL